MPSSRVRVQRKDRDWRQRFLSLFYLAQQKKSYQTRFSIFPCDFYFVSLICVTSVRQLTIIIFVSLFLADMKLVGKFRASSNRKKDGFSFVALRPWCLPREEENRSWSKNETVIAVVKNISGENEPFPSLLHLLPGIK